MQLRVGQGYDVHRLVAGRELWLGGILIPFEKGLMGHSDADVLIHAVCDALLGAAGLGDIGSHFPDNAAEYKNIDSKILFKRTIDLLAEKQWEVFNIDATLLAERPKINSYIPQMQACLAGLAQVDKEKISIKATTSEKMGFVGREEGMAAMAVALIGRK
ncbi:MAG: 2-C-methyl-D-erythritol 2,4-cyclodiphosphate synthase [Bacteroidales bacterium]|jgi:2-C-methyl-D-erythritol 2,4-cyclodiphosphate synthase|nr:2-C-methyl-D-erythritol 2,4-cyclodiphosphate synthase [Bacteroidota bacterium]